MHDNDCTSPGNGVLSYSSGERIDLDENNLDENNGICGPGFEWDWNGNDVIEDSVVFNVNTYDSEVGQCGGSTTILRDFDDWANLFFGGVGDADGTRRLPVEIITEQPVPAEALYPILSPSGSSQQ